MGDRANVVIKERNNRVFLYTHWSGEELPEVVHAALKRGESRWDDPAYLARIVFCDMVKGRETSLTGYGIAAYAPDNTSGRPFIVIDTDQQRIFLESEGRDDKFGEEILSMPIAEFVEEPGPLMKAYAGESES